LINATLPDDNVHAARTSYGWSILDFCATEIFEFALRLSNGGNSTVLSTSPIMLQRRYEYGQMLDSLGGFGESVRLYCQSQQQIPQVRAFEPIIPAIPQPEYTPKQAHFQIQQFPPEPNEVIESVKKPDEDIKFEPTVPAISQSDDTSKQAYFQGQQFPPEPKQAIESVAKQSHFQGQQFPPEPKQTIESVAKQSHFQTQQFLSKPKDMTESVAKQSHFQTQQFLPKPSEANDSVAKPTLKKDGNSSGWLGGIISKLVPGGPNQMILPSDKDIPEGEKVSYIHVWLIYFLDSLGSTTQSLRGSCRRRSNSSATSNEFTVSRSDCCIQGS
jgi:hypothetical protein